jgi:hypothetical protein
MPASAPAWAYGFTLDELHRAGFRPFIPMPALMAAFQEFDWGDTG